MSTNSSELKQVTIYTDGACTGNPGPGGYGVVLLCGQHRKELSGGFRLTTNNRMEMMAAIVGLQSLKGKCAVTVYSDSQYVVEAIEKGWAARWKANGWKRNKKEKAVNPDLWDQLLTLCSQHEVKFQWVRGHSGVPENERCDRLAVAAASQTDLPVDEGYENREEEVSNLSLLELEC
ncbi:ribonuclease HI [Leptolyngbya ohadii]|uniref:ribonuclease HI n=1 Tax=Leptolyngbya ohadii TaxID=1962290 RepID=UPI000B5A0F28|nr:ribonuclease HI [Leptolyngbya ohadii]